MSKDDRTARGTVRIDRARDTIQEPVRPDDPNAPPLEAARGPKGTFLLVGDAPAPAAARRRAAQGLELENDGKVAGVIQVGAGRKPKTQLDRKIDVSAADPRKKMTVRRPRRPNERVPREEFEDEDDDGGSSTRTNRIVLVTLVALVIAACVLGWLALRARSRGAGAAEYHRTFGDGYVEG